MRLMKFDENENSIPTDALYIDGYSFAERQFEGLVVKITLTPDCSDIQVSANWPKGTKKSYWEEIAKEYALQNDVFSTSPALDDDDGFIDQQGKSVVDVKQMPQKIIISNPFKPLG